MALLASPTGADDVSRREHILEKLRERLADTSVDHPLLHAHQAASVDYVYYRPYTSEAAMALAVTLPEAEEVDRFRAARRGVESEALDLLDEFYGARDALKALAVRDLDRDGTPDYRVSDYYGKLSEGDIDVDGDGVRNVYDSAPYDRSRGGQDADGDGAPDAAFADRNRNGLPDHVDWAVQERAPGVAQIQLGLFRDFRILLVERNAEFDLPLAQAADDVVRRVFRRYFQEHRTLPTLRTIATEKTALLGPLLALLAEDDTSAQVFSQTQSLTVYDPGRTTQDALGLLGLFAHEMGHNYHMSLDWDASNPDLENRRTDFSAPRFARTIARFGWTVNGSYDGRLDDALKPAPQFLYTGISEPVFQLKGRTPEDWDGWLNAIYDELGAPEDYLTHPSFVREEVVGDYSLTTPYEWYGDNLLAYVVTVLEETAIERLWAAGVGPEVRNAAGQRIVESLRAVWPAFHHRNLGKEARAYFHDTFPIDEDDRQLLVDRYILPIIDR